jgi:hypothetical protein
VRGLFAQSRDKAEFVERGRPQFVRQPPNLGDAALRLGRQPAE